MKKGLFLILIFSFFIFFTQYTDAGPRRMLLEFATGTWCGYCPCGDAAAEQLLLQYPNTTIIAYHGGSNDPWTNFNGNAIKTLLGFTGYPTGSFDRTNHPGNNGQPYPYVTYNMWADYAANRYAAAPNSNVNIVITGKNYNTSTRELSAVINSTALANLTGQYKIHFILIENNIVYPQDCFPTCCSEGIINNYIHKWVARTVINPVTGDNLNTASTWNQNQVITKNVSVILNTSWVAANCNLVIVVFKDSTTGMFLSSVQQTLQQSATRPIGIISSGEAAVSYSLSQNYPNPFNPKTNIEFSIPEDGTASLKIYDAVGKLVAIYLDGFIKAGIYNAEIDGTSLTSGVYFYRLISSDFIETKKMILIK